MFDRTLPQKPGIHSPELIAIGPRLSASSGHGREQARVLWWIILSHGPWAAPARPTWASNETLAREAGISLTDAAEGVACLRRAGMLTTPLGRRPGAQRKFGRLLVPAIPGPTKVVMPTPASMASLWALCRGVRARPAALVATMTGLSVLAGSKLEAEPWVQVNLGSAELCRFLGVHPNEWHRARLEQLRQLELVRWTTGGLAIAPTSTWDVSARAMAKSLELRRQLEKWKPSGWVG